MPRRLLLTTTAALLSLTVFVRAADDLVLARFSDYLDALRVQAGVPGLSAAIVGATSVTWEHAYGLQDVDRNIQARLDTPYQIDGLTQTVVAALLLRCADSGWISLDDRGGKYRPGRANAVATLRQLLTHTSAGANGLVFNYSPGRPVPP